MNIDEIKNQIDTNLLPVLCHELKSGNEIERVDKPAGSNCPYAVIFKSRLFTIGSEIAGQLEDEIEFWESNDPHYPKEKGYFSTKSRHAIAGPI